MIKLTFLGGASEIGASSTLVEVGETSILIDCGTRFRKGNALPDLDQLVGKKLDAIVVTHAHTDHTGALPVVHEAYPDTPIYLTPPTMDLIGILQRDALILMEKAQEQEGELPLYSERQVESLMSVLRPAHFGECVPVNDLEVRFLPASHILGAAMVHLSTPSGHVLFTGDYSVSAQKTVPALDRPTLHVDLVVTESTYGNRLHSDRRAAETRLISRVAEITGNEGRVLIPAFAIGRAQEVLLVLKQAMREKKMPRVPIFVDGMVRAVCGVYSRHERYATRSLAYDIVRRGHPFFTDAIRPIAKPEERKEVLEGGPCVIVASSGMLSGGPSAYYASEMAGCARDAILITGYQDEESPGRALLDLAESTGPRTLRVNNREVEVRCTFETYGLSAHADRMQMVGLIESLKPRSAILVHGDAEARATLARNLSCPDVALAEDGLQLNRWYPARRLSRVRSSQVELEFDTEALRRVVGESDGQALRVEQLAEAWFGRSVDAEKRELLVRALEEADLVRRDDHRRGMVWPLTPRVKDAEPDEEELALEADLKARNPKGRLLELCMRLRVPEPEKLATIHEGRPVVELHVEVNGERFSSGIQQAYTEKLAEQIAARELLNLLDEKLAGEELEPIGDPEALKRDNPKGRLLELCMQNKRPHPEFEVVPVPGGFAGRVRWAGYPGGTYVSARYLGDKARIVEQAAAAELLAHLASMPPRGTARGKIVEATGRGDGAEAVEQGRISGASERGAVSEKPGPGEGLETPRAGHETDEPPRTGDRADIGEGAASDTGTRETEAPDAGIGEDTGTVAAPTPRVYTSPPPGPDFRIRLNELRQLGVIRAFGYEDVASRGPSHLPVFVMKAWAELPDGVRIESDLCEAPNKKLAQRVAAGALGEALRDAGVLAGEGGQAS